MFEGRVLAGLKERLLSPEVIAAAVEEARLASVTQRREAMTKESRLRRRLGEVTWAWVAASTRSPRACRPGNCETACRAWRMAGPPSRRSCRTSRSPRPTSLPHPALAEAYRRKVEELEQVLGDDSPEAREALQVVRSLIRKIKILPYPEAPNGVWLEIEGDLAVLLRASAGAEQAKTPKAVALGVLQVSVDAGTGFEPVTFRL